MLPLAARNITPSRPLYELARLVQAILRAIPELIMLLLFNVALGFSPFASVLALTFHGIGVKGKLFAEAVEEMDIGAVECGVRWQTGRPCHRPLCLTRAMRPSPKHCATRCATGS